MSYILWKGEKTETKDVLDIRLYPAGYLVTFHYPDPIQQKPDNETG